MKIDLEPALAQLTRLQRDMGAAEEPELPEAVRGELRESGIETSIFNIPVHPEGLLTWRGQVVVLYIRNQHAGSTGYRFHVAECGTLETMRYHGRGSRYVVTNRSDGRFPVRSGYGGPVQLLPMVVCKNCLKRLDWDGYGRAGDTQRDRIIAAFDIAAFFETYTNARAPVRWAKPVSPPSPQAKPKSAYAVKSLPGPTTPPLVPTPAPAPVPAPAPAPVLASSPAPDEAWATTIADAQFRQAILQLQRHGSLSESELFEMVGGARRARRFDLSLEEWFRDAPFRVEVRSVRGVKSYVRNG